MYLFYSVFLIAALHFTCGNCDKEYNALKLQELLSTLNHNSDKDLTHKIDVIVLKTDRDHGKNINLNTLYNDLNYRRDSNLNMLKDKVEKARTAKMLRYEHRKKVEELVDFLADHYSSTNYFYNEMQRIQQQRAVKDKMREMIDYLEHPDHWRLKDKIISIFERLKRKRDNEANLWNANTNNLVINVLKDPYNDGVN